MCVECCLGLLIRRVVWGPGKDLPRLVGEGVSKAHLPMGGKGRSGLGQGHLEEVILGTPETWRDTQDQNGCIKGDEIEGVWHWYPGPALRAMGWATGLLDMAESVGVLPLFGRATQTPSCLRNF